MRLLVVGGDAAGMSAASTAKRRSPDLEVVVLEKGRWTSYSACGIPYLVGGWVDGGLDALVVRTPEEHRANGLDVRTGAEAVALDLTAREVVVRDDAGEHREGFDQLVLATGARASVPPVPGAEAAEPVRTLGATERLLAELEQGPRTAVVVGGGYIGVELAEALVHRGLEVTVVDQREQLFGGVLDPDVAAHVAGAARDVGIRLHLGHGLARVEVGDDGRPRAAVLDDTTLAADLVVVAAGAKPDVALAEDAGLATGAGGALVVDDRMRVPGHDGVWAAGDCVESRHRLTGRGVNVQLGTHANKQGRVAGVDATGGDERFPGVLGTAISRLCHREVARTGLTEAEAAAAGFDACAETVTSRVKAGYLTDDGEVVVKLVAERGTGRLLGAQLVGAETAGKRIDVLATAIWNGMDVEELQWVDLAYAPPVSPTLDPVLVAARATAKRC